MTGSTVLRIGPALFNFFLHSIISLYHVILHRRGWIITNTDSPFTTAMICKSDDGVAWTVRHADRTQPRIICSQWMTRVKHTGLVPCVINHTRAGSELHMWTKATETTDIARQLHTHVYTSVHMVYTAIHTSSHICKHGQSADDLHFTKGGVEGLPSRDTPGHWSRARASHPINAFVYPCVCVGLIARTETACTHHTHPVIGAILREQMCHDCTRRNISWTRIQ